MKKDLVLCIAVAIHEIKFHVGHKIAERTHKWYFIAF